MTSTTRAHAVWAWFFALLFVVATATSVVFKWQFSNDLDAIKQSVVSDSNVYKISQENNYKQALYGTCDSLKNLEADLGKVAMSTNKQHQAKLLANVVLHANFVNNNLAHLPIYQTDALGQTERYVNQTQDFATFLVGQLANGQPVSQKQRTSLRQLQTVAKHLYTMFVDYAESGNAMFLTNGNGMGVGTLSDMMDSISEQSFAYEQLIYDGPFSDSVEQQKIPLGKLVTPEQGLEIVQKIFGNATFQGETKTINTYYNYSLQNGGDVLVTKDGRIAQFDGYVPHGNGKLNKEECISLAQDFAKKLGYDVSAIWVSKSQDFLTYVNLVHVVDGVAFYPDMVKIAVDCSVGKVVGVEAVAYLTNHATRVVNWGNVGQEQAQKSISADLKVENTSKCFVQVGQKQYFAYQFQCTDGQNQYFVYVDSHSGQEVQIFKVIENTEGYTVM